MPNYPGNDGRDGGGGESSASSRQTRRKHSVAAAWLALTVALVSLVIGIGASEHYRIRKVIVCCMDESLRQEAGEQAARLQCGSIWLPPTREIVRSIGGLARALGVDVRRAPPDTLIITVYPRQPVAVVAVGDRNMLIDEEGICLNWTGSPPDSMMVLRISDSSGLNVGSKLGERDAELFGDVLSGLREVNLVAGTSLDISSRYRITVTTRDHVLGKLGNPKLLRAKTIFFGKLLICLRACHCEPKYIDLRVPSRPTYCPAD